MSNNTVYIPTPISQLPKEKGAYLMMYPDGIFSNQFYLFKNGKWQHNLGFRSYTHWLNPTPLSSLHDTMGKLLMERDGEIEGLKNKIVELEKFIELQGKEVDRLSDCLDNQ